MPMVMMDVVLIDADGHGGCNDDDTTRDVIRLNNMSHQSISYFPTHDETTLLQGFSDV